VVEKRDHETVQDFRTRIEKAAVFRSIENLMTFPCVKILVERGKLQLHGAYFGVADGDLFVLDQESKQFVPAVKVV
jgi:carbonic anhydrase